MSKALDFYLDLCSSGTIEKDQNQIDLLTELEIFLSNSIRASYLRYPKLDTTTRAEDFLILCNLWLERWHCWCFSYIHIVLLLHL